MNELSFLDSLFNDVLGSNTVYVNGSSPKVDVMEEKNAYTLEMELPGRCENDVTIELDHDNLTIASKKEAEEKENKEEKDKSERYILRERRKCCFERRFTLPSDVDLESIQANFKNGILTINMQKKAIEPPKQIAIQAC